MPFKCYPTANDAVCLSLVFPVPAQANLVLPNLEPFLLYSPKLGALTQQLQLPRWVPIEKSPPLVGVGIPPTGKRSLLSFSLPQNESRTRVISRLTHSCPQFSDYSDREGAHCAHFRRIWPLALVLAPLQVCAPGGGACDPRDCGACGGPQLHHRVHDHQGAGAQGTPPCCSMLPLMEAVLKHLLGSSCLSTNPGRVGPPSLQHAVTQWWRATLGQLLVTAAQDGMELLAVVFSCCW